MNERWEREDLGLPDVLGTILSESGGGLVVIAGQRGSGITTTLYSLVDRINTSYRTHIMTFEDPTEANLAHKLSIISQREQDLDFANLSEALSQSWRQGALVTMIGRLDAPEDLIAACQAGCKGQIVLAGVEAGSVIDAVQKFHKAMGPTSWLTFCDGLAALCHQRLLPDLSGGRSPVMEVFRNTPDSRELLDQCDWSGVIGWMERDRLMGMQTLEQGLFKAVQEGKIARAEAFRTAHNVERLQSLFDAEH